MLPPIGASKEFVAPALAPSVVVRLYNRSIIDAETWAIWYQNTLPYASDDSGASA